MVRTNGGVGITLITLSIVISSLSLASCTHGSRPPNSEEMYIKASALTKLSAAVESTVRYKNPPLELSESELLTLATRHDPVLLENFKDYKVRVLRQERHSVVLVCDASGSRALLEDAGCSGRMDRERWMGKPESCEFSIDAKEVCGGD
ncbi:hypothetical protein [Nitrosospira briensis]|uniref:Lipoprotein n=1 Tax=Nitrosospira briensis TaxID=35799 RepID=A0A1I4Z8Q7_9PROT|nr:hypothetical protein [Nitrosospira briensis]SFN46646.1 hypothetical protein SAMN05216386_1092 [Nitrosospira briensis]SFO23951.1 hypothetical protein SAMN05216332_108111 [Nitrosospira briensis]